MTLRLVQAEPGTGGPCVSLHTCVPVDEKRCTSPSETKGNIAHDMSSESPCEETPRKPGSCSHQSRWVNSKWPNNLQRHSAGSQDHLKIGNSAKNNTTHHPKQTAPVLHPGLCRASETLRSFSSSEASTLIQLAVSNEVTFSFPGAEARQSVLLVLSWVFLCLTLQTLPWLAS